MSRKRQRPKMSPAELIEIRLLRLAAGLRAVLDACDVLFDELGWGPLGPSENADEVGHFLN